MNPANEADQALQALLVQLEILRQQTLATARQLQETTDALLKQNYAKLVHTANN